MNTIWILNNLLFSKIYKGFFIYFLSNDLQHNVLELPRSPLAWILQDFKTFISNYRLNLVILFEPRISESKADGFIKKRCFQISHQMEVKSFSNGIWILWDDNFEVEFIINHSQFIHLKIIDLSGFNSWVMAVYASLIPMVRNILWFELDEVAKYVDGPWMIGGDFNAIRKLSKKRGWSNRISGVCDLFNGRFHRNYLMEPFFKGP